jgi:hypothetical protein
MKNIYLHFAVVIFLLLTTGINAIAQKGKAEIIPLKADNWEFKSGTVEFTDHHSKKAMKLLPGSDVVVLKNFSFTDGTIEYDMEPLVKGFTSVYFRWKDPEESEIFYFRTWAAGDPQSMNAVQYAPTIKGVNLWDLMFHFQANATYKNNEWNHVKLVVSGKQMRAYVNDMSVPALEIPMLEGNTSSGTLAFDGQVAIANLIVKPGETEGLNPEPGIDPVANDTRYLRKWQVSEPIITEKGIDFRNSYYPGDSANWQDITAERRGLINLSRKFGQINGRRIVWLKTTIHSDKDQDKTLRLGFSEEVWMLINKKPLYVDKNLYNTPMQKQPGGRCSIDNASITVPLKEGDNELLVGVSNFFYGWGIVARFDDLDGIKIQL